MIKRALTRKITRQYLYAFLEQHRTPVLTLEVGAKREAYTDLFPNTVAGDLAFYPSLDAQLDAHHLPFPDQSFVNVLCVEVLEHCVSPQRAIDEFYRVLKPGGQLILTTRFIFPIHDAPHDYFRFTRYGLQLLCTEFAQVDVTSETPTVGALAMILQRLAAQCDWRVPGIKLLLQVLARLVLRACGLLRTEYADISKHRAEQGIMASGYYVVAVK